jgi:hypothetical protein
MSKLKFNPDDFVFQQLPSPDERKTILEYDAVNRIILMRTKDDFGQYVYNSIFISQKINNLILQNIPDEWSNNNDRIVLFSIYEDGEYIFEKEKLKYDFTTKSTKWIRYSSDYLTVQQAKELYEVINTAVFLDNAIETYNNTEEYLELANKTYYLQQLSEKNNSVVQKLLRNSDWRVLPDYPDTFENEREMWIKWREEIRKMEKNVDDFEDPLDYLIYNEELRWPIRPDMYYEMYSDLSVEYLSENDQFVKNPAIIDEEYGEENRKAILSMAEKMKEFQESGINLGEMMKEMIKKYDLIKDLEEFKKIKLNGVEQ